MREIKIGNKEVRVRATPLTLLIYKREFKTDMLSDLISMSDVLDDNSKIEGLKILQFAWAMAATDKFGKSFPSFEKWLSQFEYIDFGDEKTTFEIVEVAQEGLFRESGKVKEITEEREENKQ